MGAFGEREEREICMGESAGALLLWELQRQADCVVWVWVWERVRGRRVLTKQSAYATSRTRPGSLRLRLEEGWEEPLLHQASSALHKLQCACHLQARQAPKLALLPSSHQKHWHDWQGNHTKHCKRVKKSAPSKCRFTTRACTVRVLCWLAA